MLNAVIARPAGVISPLTVVPADDEATVQFERRSEPVSTTAPAESGRVAAMEPVAGGREVLRTMPYVAGFALVGFATRAGLPGVALAVCAIAVVAGVNQAAATTGSGRVLVMAVTVVAIERILSLAVPYLILGHVGWYIAIAVPTLAGIALVASIGRYSLRDLGLLVDGWVVFVGLLTVAPGLAVGLAYHGIAGSLALVDERGTANVLAPAVAVAIAAALVEEVLFRGILQRAASRYLGPVLGILYVAVLYTLLAAPWSVVGITVVFATALWFAALRTYTSSIVPAAVAHASVNIGLVMVAASVAR